VHAVEQVLHRGKLHYERDVRRNDGARLQRSRSVHRRWMLRHERVHAHDEVHRRRLSRRRVRSDERRVQRTGKRLQRR
jgi:hypothetical protein